MFAKSIILKLFFPLLRKLRCEFVFLLETAILQKLDYSFSFDLNIALRVAGIAWRMCDELKLQIMIDENDFNIKTCTAEFLLKRMFLVIDSSLSRITFLSNY